MYLIVFFVIILISIGYVFTKKIFFHSFYTDKVLVSDFTINDEWQDLEFNKPLIVEKENQFISIVLEPPFEAEITKKGIKMPSGEITQPEIKLIDLYDREYNLALLSSRGGERGNNIANYGYKNGYKVFPFGSKFKKIKIRSDKEVDTKQILWSGYNATDLK